MATIRKRWGTGRRPRIAVLLDEDTSRSGTKYEADKAYFSALAQVGGLPFGIPYQEDMIDIVLDEFDAFLAVGGRFAYPDNCYIDGEHSAFPASERPAIQRTLMEGFLERDKPVLGICAGMQMLACLNGGRLTPDLTATTPLALVHDRADITHTVAIRPDTLLARLTGESRITVNSFHREAVAEPGDGITVSATAPDGVVEAIELPGHTFALGIQWHQERLFGHGHPGDHIFAGLVAAA